MVQQYDIKIPSFNRGFHLITRYVEQALLQLPESGILHLFIRHTSAGLAISENADPSVRTDLETIFNRLAPEDFDGYTHTMEGPDDMPAHIKSILTGSTITIPIRKKKLDLGKWQGIYLCEFRDHGGQRKITATIIS